MSEKNISAEVEAIAKQAWDSNQRIAMRIAGIPVDGREDAFQLAKDAMRESGSVHGLSPDQIEGWIDIQIKCIRSMVTDIDVGGRPEGGHA